MYLEDGRPEREEADAAAQGVGIAHRHVRHWGPRPNTHGVRRRRCRRHCRCLFVRAAFFFFLFVNAVVAAQILVFVVLLHVLGIHIHFVLRVRFRILDVVLHFQLVVVLIRHVLGRLEFHRPPHS